MFKTGPYIAHASYVIGDDLELADPAAYSSSVLELQACIIRPSDRNQSFYVVDKNFSNWATGYLNNLCSIWHNNKAVIFSLKFLNHLNNFHHQKYKRTGETNQQIEVLAVKVEGMSSARWTQMWEERTNFCEFPCDLYMACMLHRCTGVHTHNKWMKNGGKHSNTLQ